MFFNFNSMFAHQISAKSVYKQNFFRIYIYIYIQFRTVSKALKLDLDIVVSDRMYK